MTEMTSIPHQLTTRTKLLHKVAIVRQGKVLLLQRSTAALSRPGCWDLPGGNSEWPSAVTEPTSDLHRQDIIREIREETGFVVSETVFDTSALVLFRSFFDPTAQVFSIICGWYCSGGTITNSVTADSSFSVTLSAEHQSFVWATLEELAAYDFGGEKGAFVEEIARQALNRSSE